MFYILRERQPLDGATKRRHLAPMDDTTQGPSSCLVLVKIMYQG